MVSLHIERYNLRASLKSTHSDVQIAIELRFYGPVNTIKAKSSAASSPTHTVTPPITVIVFAVSENLG